MAKNAHDSMAIIQQLLLEGGMVARISDPNPSQPTASADLQRQRTLDFISEETKNYASTAPRYFPSVEESLKDSVG